MLELIILLIGVLLASGACSMTEAAILSVSSLRSRIFLDRGYKGAKDLVFIKDNIHKTIAFIVILNNAINIGGSIFVGQKALYLFGNRWVGVYSALMTFLIIVLGEAIPKTIGQHYRNNVALSTAKPLRFLMFIFTPLVQALIFITNIFRRPSVVPKITEEEIKIMLKLGKAEGTVEANEEKLCSRVFKLNDVTSSSIMKPIGNIYALPADKTLLEVKDLILNSQYSRIAIYEGDISNIVGICQQRVLLKEIAKDNYTSKVKEFALKPIFVNETEEADELLTKFQNFHQHLFIVRDKKGKNIGIVSMEDVLEELFGEIYDEKDRASSPYRV